MKTTQILLLTVAFVATTLTANGQAFRIDDPVGTVVEYNVLNKKEKVTGTNRMELVSKESSAEGEVFNLRTTMTLDKEPVDLTYRLIFTGDGVKPDKNFLFGGSMMEQMKGQMEIKFDGEIPILPDNLSVGQELPLFDIVMTVDLTGGAGAPIAMKSITTMKTTSRKILRKESVTVPAGTFDAFVLNEVVTATSAIMGIKTTVQSSTDSWVVPELGYVKQLHYDKKGKIASGTVLAKRTN